MMVIPSSLKKGDCIALLATARKISYAEIEPAVKIFEAAGFKVKTGASIGAEHNQFAGNSDLRAKDFQQMLDDDTVKAIICARGGYGTVQIIDKIDFSGFIKKPKWIVGYSDVTVLHAHIQQNFGIQTLHATMPVNFPKTATNSAVETLIEALKGVPLVYKFSIDKSVQHLVKAGKAEGILVGGNLSVLYSLCGSASFPDTSGKVLFIEDLDEYLYHIDRMMMNLKRNGVFDNLNTLIVGGMNDMNDNAIAYGKTAEEIISENVKEYNFPVLFGFPAGHIENNLALKMGAMVQLQIEKEKASIKFL